MVLADHPVTKEIKELFSVDEKALRNIAELFKEQMLLAANQQPSSLRALPSFLPAATGREQGNYLTIDLGGTNIRVSSVTLHGNGQWSVQAKVQRPWRDPDQGYDLTTADTDGEELFDFVADLVAQVYALFPTHQLAMTFSYPMEQQSKREACLLHWTKELKPRNTVGRRIDQMLMDALNRRGLQEITLEAILNDTTACFLTASYQERGVIAGSICGTGHNTCCLYPFFPGNPPIIINLESGNFHLLPANDFDAQLDALTENPGQQRLEKMTAGKYMGELWRLVYWEMVQKNVLPPPALAWLEQPFSVNTEQIGYIYADPASPSSRQWSRQWGLDHYPPEQLSVLQAIASAIIQRSMGFIAAGYAGIITALPAVIHPSTIAVDGAVFHFLPGFTSGVERLLADLLPENPARLKLTPDGSSIGAAVAAALPLYSME